MAGIVSATQAQVLTARDALVKLQDRLQKIANGSMPPASKLNTAQIASTDALVDAAVAALAPLNT